MKRQTDYLTIRRYRPTFKVKVSPMALFWHGLQFIACFGFLLIMFYAHDFDFSKVVAAICNSPTQSKIVTIGFYCLLAFGSVHAIVSSIVHFNLRLRVDGDILSIRNRFRITYQINKSQIVSIKTGGIRNDDGRRYLYIKFTVNGHSQTFVALVYWKNLSPLEVWAEHHNITIVHMKRAP